MQKLELAYPQEATEILQLYHAAAEAGQKTGRSEWDEFYPTMQNILADLEQSSLYVLRENGRIVAAISLVSPEDLDGRGISWTKARSREACRFCLMPEMQGKGLAADIFLSALDLLRAQGVEAVRYLCAKGNPAAYRLYTRLGHRQLEDTTFEEVEFFSFEVML